MYAIDFLLFDQETMIQHNQHPNSHPIIYFFTPPTNILTYQLFRLWKPASPDHCQGKLRSLVCVHHRLLLRASLLQHMLERKLFPNGKVKWWLTVLCMVRIKGYKVPLLLLRRAATLANEKGWRMVVVSGRGRGVDKVETEWMGAQLYSRLSTAELTADPTLIFLGL